MLIACTINRIDALEISPLSQVGPKVERWGWDIKAWAERLDTLTEADFLYGQNQANLLRVPVFATAHEQDGTINTADYSTEIAAMRNVQRINSEVEIFASLKLQGANTYPDWLGDGTSAWPQSNGTIFGQVVERPNPEHYANLLADYVEYLQQFRIEIDYLGINNETDGALGVNRYIATIDLLEAELINRGVPTEYRSFQYVGPDSFGLNTTENIVQNIANQGRLDTVDIVGSHFYPQHISGDEETWEDISSITSGVPMWHTEVHMPVGNAQYAGDQQQAFRDTLSVLFASNKRGVDSFVWWDTGHEANKMNDTIKRGIVDTTLDAIPVLTTPTFTAKDDPGGEILYQAYVKGDVITLWIANPGTEISLEVLDLNGAKAISTPNSIFWEGQGNTITSTNSGQLDITVGSNGDELRIRDLPGQATMYLQFRFELDPGDFDRDGDVDLGDYSLWQADFGSTESLLADGNNNGIIDAADYTIWRDNYSSSSPFAISVPEPTSYFLFATSILFATQKRKASGSGRSSFQSCK